MNDLLAGNGVGPDLVLALTEAQYRLVADATAQLDRARLVLETVVSTLVASQADPVRGALIAVRPPPDASLVIRPEVPHA